MWHLQLVCHAGPALAGELYGATAEKALAQCARALELAPESIGLRFGCGVSLLAVGRGAYGRQAAELLCAARACRRAMPPRGSCSAKRNGCSARLAVPPTEPDQGARAVALISSSRRMMAHSCSASPPPAAQPIPELPPVTMTTLSFSADTIVLPAAFRDGTEMPILFGSQANAVLRA